MVAAAMTALIPGAGPPPTRIASVFLPFIASAHLAARRHRPHGLDRAVAHAVDLVDHVAHHAAVVGHDLHGLADLGPCATCREVDHAVLLGEVDHLGLRVLEQ